MRKRFLCLALVLVLTLVAIPFAIMASADEPEAEPARPVIEGTLGEGTADDYMRVDEYSELVAAVNAGIEYIRIVDDIYVNVDEYVIPSKYFLRFGGGKTYNIDLNTFEIRVENIYNKFMTADNPLILIEDATVNFSRGTIFYENENIVANNLINSNPFVYVGQHGVLNSYDSTFINYTNGNAVYLDAGTTVTFDGGMVESSYGYAVYASSHANNDLTLTGGVQLVTYMGTGDYYKVNDTGYGALYFNCKKELTVDDASFVGGIVVSKDQLDEFSLTNRRVDIGGYPIENEIYKSDKPYYKVFDDAKENGNTYNWAETNDGTSRYYIATIGETSFEYCYLQLGVENYAREFDVTVKDGYAYKIVSTEPYKTEVITKAKCGDVIYIEEEVEDPFRFVEWSANVEFEESRKEHHTMEFTMPYESVTFTALKIDESHEITEISFDINQPVHGELYTPEFTANEEANYYIGSNNWLVSDSASFSNYEIIREPVAFFPDLYHQLVVLIYPKDGYFFGDNVSIGSPYEGFRVTDYDSKKAYLRVYLEYEVPTNSFMSIGETYESVAAIYGTYTINVEENEYANPETYDLEFTWYKDGKVIEGANDKSYTFSKDDGGHIFAARVVATSKVNDSVQYTFFTGQFTCSKQIGAFSVSIDDLTFGMHGTDAGFTLDLPSEISLVSSGWNCINEGVETEFDYENCYFEPGVQYVLILKLKITDGYHLNPRAVISVGDNSELREPSIVAGNITLSIEVCEPFEAPFPVYIGGGIGMGGELYVDTAKMALNSDEFKSALESGNVTYQWMKNGKPIADANGETLKLTDELLDCNIQCNVTANGILSFNKAITTNSKIVSAVYIYSAPIVVGLPAPQKNSYPKDSVAYRSNVWYYTTYEGGELGGEIYGNAVFAPDVTYYAEVNSNVNGMYRFDKKENLSVYLDDKKVEICYSYKDTVIEYIIEVKAKENATTVHFDPPKDENYLMGDTLRVDVSKMANENSEFAAALNAGQVTYTWYTDMTVIEGATTGELHLSDDLEDKNVRVIITYGDKVAYSRFIVADKLVGKIEAFVSCPIVGYKLEDVKIYGLGGNRYFVFNDAFWYIVDGEGNKTQLDDYENTKIEAGVTYELMLMIKPRTGYKYADEVQFFLNGVEKSGLEYTPGDTGHSFFSFSFTADESLSHQLGELTEQKNATCSTTGMKAHYFCEACNHYVDENKITRIEGWFTIPVNDKIHVYGDWNEEVPATCMSTGTVAHKQCTLCERYFDNSGNRIEDITISVDASAHKWEATYIANGDNRHYRICEHNAEHKLYEDCLLSTATCQEKATCEKCNTAYGDFGGHNFTGVTLNEEIPATCVATGTKAYKDCTVCHKHFAADGVTEIADLTLPIDGTNHDMATEWTGVADGHYHVCKRTGCEYHDTLVGHSSSGTATEQNAETCTVCQYIITPALGHTTCSGGIKQNGQSATCTVDGWNDYYKCSGCNKYYTDAACTNEITDLAAWKTGAGKITAGHTPNADDGDCTTAITCSVCGAETTAASTHVDADTNGKCDTCSKDMPTTPGTDDPNAGNTEDPTDDNDGLSGGAIAGIVIGSTVVAGTGGFALVWFVIKKKSFAELLAIFKKK